ncbi:SCP2 sterol-binding domain-containing protein [Asanoa siamensis]|uniref:SCP2 sterol-binding domain-containing protein n=1 Tax=Asanoa siamensis TaxID=926357 RepID=UPI0019445E4A|nr:SCP2 sterol-binding domain-containing protein [Asanoa siamensis]
MATVDECRDAMHELAARLAGNADAQSRLDLERTVACRLTDLDAAFHGRLHNGQLIDIADGDDPKAKIALSLKSDDFLALVRGDLDVTRAVAAGQMRIKANPFDLLKLRKLL